MPAPDTFILFLVHPNQTERVKNVPFGWFPVSVRPVAVAVVLHVRSEMVRNSRALTGLVQWV